MKIKLIIALSLFLSLGFASVSAQTIVDTFYFDAKNDFINNFNDCLHKLADRRSVAIVEHDAKENRTLQLEQIESNVASGNPMIVNLVDPQDASKVIDLATPLQNRIVFFNRIPSPSVMDSYPKAWYVGANSLQSGVFQAQMVLDYLKKFKNNFDRNGNGKLDVIVLQGEKTHQDTLNRTQAVINSIFESGYNLNLISKNHSNWSRELAKRDVKLQIDAEGLENIDMIIANNDAMALGAVDFLNTQGFNLGDRSGYDIDPEQVCNPRTIPVFGVDGLPEALIAVKQGRIAGTVYSDFTAIAKVCVDLARLSAQTDEELTQQIWYKVKDKYVSIPYLKYARYKNYLYEAHRYPQDGVSYSD